MLYEVITSNGLHAFALSKSSWQCSQLIFECLAQFIKTEFTNMHVPYWCNILLVSCSSIKQSAFTWSPIIDTRYFLSLFDNFRRYETLSAITKSSPINAANLLTGSVCTISSIWSRITSYNVCYTKLLRYIWS